MRDKMALAISMVTVWGCIWGCMYLVSWLHGWLSA